MGIVFHFSSTQTRYDYYDKRRIILLENYCIELTDFKMNQRQSASEIFMQVGIKNLNRVNINSCNNILSFINFVIWTRP